MCILLVTYDASGRTGNSTQVAFTSLFQNGACSSRNPLRLAEKLPYLGLPRTVPYLRAVQCVCVCVCCVGGWPGWGHGDKGRRLQEGFCFSPSQFGQSPKPLTDVRLYCLEGYVTLAPQFCMLQEGMRGKNRSRYSRNL